jgi:hypothetical protein
MDNYFNYLPDQIKVSLLGKLNSNNFDDFCDFFDSNLCKSKSTWRILIKNNYPKLYNSLFVTGYLYDNRLDISFYYIYKERLSFVIDYDMYANYRRIMSEMVKAHPDQIIEKLQKDFHMFIKEQIYIGKSTINDIIITLICYRNWPGTYPKIEKIIQFEPYRIGRLTSIYDWLMFGSVKNYYSADILNSLIYSMKFNSPIIDEYLVKGKLEHYPSLRKLSESIPSPIIDFHTSHNYMFLFLYSREPEVNINDLILIEITKFVNFLSYISRQFGYDIDWVIDKLDENNINLIYNNLNDEEGDLSKREIIKLYYKDARI